MKKIFLLLLCIVVSVSICFATDPVEGLWKSVDEKTNKTTGVWKIYIKDSKLFGEMMICVGFHPNSAATACKDSYSDFPKSGKVKNMALIGTPFIYNLEKKDIGEWQKGYIIDPGNGKRYNCKISFCKADGKKFKVDTLKMRGEISIGLGRNQWWVRSSKEEVDTLIKNNVVVNEYVEATE